MSNIVKPKDAYRTFMSEGLAADAREIANRWLHRLTDVVQEDRRDIFPTEQYLDHIPQMISEMGAVLDHSDIQLALANSMIHGKARELGKLRHQQQASVNQLLREYDILAQVLEAYVLERTPAYPGEIHFDDGIAIMSFFARMVRSIMQTTIDCFVELYSKTISHQTEKILSFNSFISHELKTPMQSAMLNIELMMEERSTEHRDVEGLQKVESAISQMASLLGNLENLVSNDSAEVADDAASQKIDLSTTMKDVGSRFSESLELRSIELTIDDHIGMITVDKARLETVLNNILTNAIKYSDPKKPRSTIEISSAPCTTADHIAFTITDNGMGIEDEVITKVFELYYRAHRTPDRQPSVGGHGIGLYLVREAVHEMGGTVELASRRNQWTRFTIMLPRSAVEKSYGSAH